MELVTRLAGALVVALVLGLSWHLDEGRDGPAEFAQVQALEDAQRAAQAAARREHAAQAMCASAGSENTAAIWQADGSVACRTKRGKLIATITAGAL
jgi:hypothetical protein